MVNVDQVISSSISGAFTAGAFIVLGLVVGVLNGIIGFGVATWTILAILLLLSAAGIKLKVFRLPELLVSLGFTGAILSILVFLVPALSPVLAPFEASLGSNVIEFIAILLHLSGAVTLGGMVRQRLKI